MLMTWFEVYITLLLIILMDIICFCLYVDGTMPLIVGYVDGSIYSFSIIFFHIICAIYCW
jgi:hypothetical protein